MCPSDDNDFVNTDDDGRNVMDVSKFWLAQKDEERKREERRRAEIEARQRAEMEELKRLVADAEQLIPPDFLKTANEARRRAVRMTQELARFVEDSPPQHAIHRNLDFIFETFQLTTGFHQLAQTIMRLADALLLPLEQLGEWERMEAWFMQIFPILADYLPKEIPHWQRMIIRHFKYTGQRTRMDVTINDLLEGDQSAPHEHLLWILLRSGTTDAEHKLVSSELLDIAELRQDYALMMQVHGYIANRYLEKYDFKPAFAHAQQIFILAVHLQNSRFQALAAWYMASVFHQFKGNPHKALEYTDLAMDHADVIHDKQWLVQMRAIRGLSFHALRRNQEAVEELAVALPHLHPSGLFYARILYVWCAAMSFLNPTEEQFAEIEAKLRVAMLVFRQQKSFADILNVHMAIVQLYLDQDKLCRVQWYYRKLLKPVIRHKRKGMSETHLYYVNALQKQLRERGLLH